jgi:hypothetical protein
MLNKSIAATLVMSAMVSQGASAADDSANLAQQTQNPIADLISVPVKLDWDTDIGPEDADRSTYVVQPVIPINMNKDWNVISRTIVPVYIDSQSPVPGGNDTTGMGDILQSLFFSLKAATSDGWIWGAGPAFSLPTGDDGLTTDKFSIGPTAVALKQEDGWTYGGLFNQLWSVSGDDDAEDVSSLFLQPFVAFTTKSLTTFSINTESTYDWKAEEWTIPINAQVSQLVKLGEQPLSLLAGYRYYADTPSGGPDWGLRLQVTFLFPG